MNRHTPLRAGIIGCGGISGAHARAIIENPQAITLAACADIALDKAQALAMRCGSGVAYDDYEKMLDAEALDLVIIATWPNLHEQQVTAAARRGVPMILCEKSLAMSAASAMRMAEAARQGGLDPGRRVHGSPPPPHARTGNAGTRGTHRPAA